MSEEKSVILGRQRVTRALIQDIKDAADDLGRATGEISCIVSLLEHPKRNREDIKEWCASMHELGWTERDGRVWP